MTKEYVDAEKSVLGEESVKRLVPDWINPPYVNDLETDYQSAKPIQDSINQKIDHWLELYEAKNINYGKNRSATRPKTIKKQAKWTYPVIEEPLLAKKDLFDLQGRTSEDSKANLLNKLIINQQFRLEMNFIKFINDASRIYVNQGTLIYKIAWKRKLEKQKVVEPIFEKQPIQQEDGSVVLQDVKTGTQIVEKEVMTANHPELIPLNYKKTILDPSAKGDMSKMNFIINEYETNLSTLNKDGSYSNLDLVDYEAGIDTDLENSSFDFKDKARKRLVVKEYWGYWDTDNTGKTDMIVAVYVGNVMIKLERNPLPFDELPFEMCQFEPVFESNYGEPDAEVIKENQENIGATTRSIIDIVGRSAAGQEAIPEGYLNIVEKKKYENGEDYKYNPNFIPKEAVHMHTPPDIPSSVWNIIELQNREVDELTGKKPFNMGNSSSALSSTATAIRSTLDATSKRELGILRRFSSSLERAAYKIIAMNRLFLTDGQIFKITNDKFLAVNREHLYGQFDIKLKVTTPEETENKINKLNFKLQTMGNTLPFELTQMLISKEFQLENEPEFAEMIAQYKPQPNPIEQEKEQLQVELLKRQIAVYDSTVAENQADVDLKTAKAEESRAKVDMMDLDFIHKAEGVDHERELEKGVQDINSKMSLKELEHHFSEMQTRDEKKIK